MLLLLFSQLELTKPEILFTCGCAIQNSAIEMSNVVQLTIFSVESIARLSYTCICFTLENVFLVQLFLYFGILSYAKLLLIKLLQYLGGEVGSPVELAKSYMQSLPPWRCPSWNTQMCNACQIYKDETSNSTTNYLFSSSKVLILWLDLL